MKIAMIGTGYVGLTTGACFANLGNDVTCVDVDATKIETLRQGKVPFFEPGLSEMVTQNVQQGRLMFTTDAAAAIQAAEIIFIAVGTPSDKDGRADIKHVLNVAEAIGKHMNSFKVIVIKSTVPLGTSRKVEALIRQHQSEPFEFEIANNPEFLREGEAINDFMIPERIVIGADTDRAKQTLTKLYKPLERTNRPILVTSIESAMMIKYASNAMLSTRISFMNELSHLCERIGADIKDVAKGMGLDTRIGPRFLQAGAGYGGSCFPKDIRALASTLEDYDCDNTLMKAVQDVNIKQKNSIVPKLKDELPSLKGKKIAIWGLAFKPKTDDMREATSLTVIPQLLSQGATVTAFDPVATENARALLPNIDFAPNPYEAALDADAVIVLTEWDAFRQIDLQRVKKGMKQPIILDGRNIYDPIEIKKLGFRYQGIGR